MLSLDFLMDLFKSSLGDFIMYKFKGFLQKMKKIKRLQQNIKKDSKS